MESPVGHGGGEFDPVDGGVEASKVGPAGQAAGETKARSSWQAR